MRRVESLAVCLATAAILTLGAAGSPAQGKDYLTGIEADKIRDAEKPNDRIKLFLTFAADRLKKFNYENSRATADRRRNERLSALLEAYGGCMDDASELIQLGRTKQQDIALSVKEMQTQGKAFLAELERLAAGGNDLPYKESLTDAIQATKDALAEAAKTAKELAPPPVRRKP